MEWNYSHSLAFTIENGHLLSIALRFCSPIESYLVFACKSGTVYNVRVEFAEVGGNSERISNFIIIDVRLTFFVKSSFVNNHGESFTFWQNKSFVEHYFYCPLLCS